MQPQACDFRMKQQFSTDFACFFHNAGARIARWHEKKARGPTLASGFSLARPLKGRPVIVRSRTALNCGE
jgi:hypothetical protein